MFTNEMMADINVFGAQGDGISIGYSLSTLVVTVKRDEFGDWGKT